MTSSEKNAAELFIDRPKLSAMVLCKKNQKLKVCNIKLYFNLSNVRERDCGAESRGRQKYGRRK